MFFKSFQVFILVGFHDTFVKILVRFDEFYSFYRQKCKSRIGWVGNFLILIDFCSTNGLAEDSDCYVITLCLTNANADIFFKLRSGCRQICKVKPTNSPLTSSWQKWVTKQGIPHGNSPHISQSNVLKAEIHSFALKFVHVIREFCFGGGIVRAKIST